MPDGEVSAGKEAGDVVTVEVKWGTGSELCVDRTMVALTMGVESEVGVTVPRR